VGLYFFIFIYNSAQAFDDTDVIHVEGDLGPVRDLIIIHEELRLRTRKSINKAVDALKKIPRCSTGKGRCTGQAKKRISEMSQKSKRGCCEEGM
jgi:ribosome-binding ATPase YchF (GTP1/OBG family)